MKRFFTRDVFLEKEVPIKLWKWSGSALTEICALRPLINKAARCL